ncbi:MAG: TolC family protein [Nitrospirae bacterium]|nr:MAG: TolC family protein [Nitrospirota bacterium]
MGRIFYPVASALFIVLMVISPVAAETKELTLEQAITIAIEKHPELAAASFEVKAKGAKIVQSGVLQNPQLEFGMDNFGGSRDRQGFVEAEFSWSVSQQVELGGKRTKRVRAASIDRDISRWDYEAKKLDVINETTKMFIDVVAAQEKLIVSEELYRLAEHSFNTASARVQAGKASPIDEVKASVELAKANLELERTKGSLIAARKRLAFALGDSGTPFSKADYQLKVGPSDMSLEQIETLANKNPDVIKWDTEIAQREAALSLEKANRIPDPSISGGIKRFNGKETALIFGMSVPLPFFNLNSGAVAEAENRLEKAKKEREAAHLKTKTLLADAYLALSGAMSEAAALKDKILPSLQRAYESVHEGYKYGKFGHLEFLDAQRTLFESKKQYIESLVSYSKAAADIERLTGAGPNIHQSGQ